MKTIIVIGIVIVLTVLLLSVLTINKGYSYKHTVDPIDPITDEDEKKKKMHKKGSSSKEVV
ncbi:YtzI protein [Bacillus sp. V59.32b]|uniref:YtzI protein n=1 Tax=Bacillus sp. V59.32b TaxID=1758642 RepID=UPI000E3D9526|nr:YtzI protein [Bacillus sp. V59.32b]RFU60178.1 YtzI protein [Bacillus sp. V59.32b]